MLPVGSPDCTHELMQRTPSRGPEPHECGRQVKWSPETSMSWSLEPVDVSPYVAKGIKVADGVKVAERLTLTWRDYAGSTGWDDVSVSVLERGRGRQRRRPRRRDVRRTPPATAGCGDGGTGRGPRTAGSRWGRVGGGDGQDTASCLAARGGRQPSCLRDSSPARPTPDFCPTEL